MQWGTLEHLLVEVRGGCIVSEVPQRRSACPKNVNHVCNIILFVFSALSYCLCRQWNYHSEIQRINSSLSSLPCSPFSSPTRLRFGSHTWLPYSWPLLFISVSSSCLVGGCRGSMKETRKAENKEEECIWLWIKKGHPLVYHPKFPAGTPTWFLGMRAPGTLTCRPLSSSAVTCKFLAGCPLETWHTHRDTETQTCTRTPLPPPLP